MYQKILVAVDTSPESVTVLTKARTLARLTGASLTVVHYVEQPYINYAYGDLVAQQFLPSLDEVKEQVQPGLLKQMAEAEIPSSSLRVDFGEPVEAVTTLATEEGFDLVIVGSHGRHGLQLLLGSTANGILHHAKCDVLAVRVYEP